MPAYEYLCDTCGCGFEIRQKMSEAVIETCPQCAGSVRRLISGGAGTICKGSDHGMESRPMCSTGRPCCGEGAGCGEGQFCKS